MGNPTSKLVVVATMYDNPKGLTRDKVLNKFSKIKLGNSLKIGKYMQSGLHGFAKIFNLEHTKEYLENQRKYWNEDYKYFSKKPDLSKDSLKIIETSHKKIGETRIQFQSMNSLEFDENIFQGHKTGDLVWQGDYTQIIAPTKFQNQDYSFLVRKVLNREIKKEGPWVDINEELEAEVIKFDSKNFEFKSIGELLKIYPEYNPENIYNFDQETGFLYPYQTNKTNPESPSFKWIKKGDKYFLDFENFSRILNPNSYFGQGNWIHQRQKNKSRYSLTDVVLTSEAIRRRNWRKLVSTLSENNRKFIYKNETTFRKYERAILEIELAIEAQEKGWTNFEYLKEHQTRITNRNQIPYEQIKEMVKEENKRNGIEKRKETLKQKKKFNELLKARLERDKNKSNLKL